MPAPRFRSRTYKRVQKKLPGGSVTTQRVKRKPAVQKCAACKTELKGIPRQMPSKMQKGGVSKKRPERAFGGYYCASCARKQIKKEARE